MKRNILLRAIGPLVLVRQNAEEGSEADWSEFMGLLTAQRREYRPDELRILVYTDGGSPNAQQRALLAHTLGNFHPRVAVVSNSIKVRFAGSLIALFQRNYRQFSASELKLAFSHLQLPPNQCELAEKVLRELEAQLFSQP